MEELLHLTCSCVEQVEMHMYIPGQGRVVCGIIHLDILGINVSGDGHFPTRE